MNVEKILGIAQRIFKDDGLTGTSALHDADGYDSMEHVQFLCELEDEFGVEISDSEVLRNHTIDEVGEIVQKKLQG